MHKPNRPSAMDPIAGPPRPTVRPTFPSPGMFGGWGPRVR
jgi:hypothetical protein